MNKEVEISSQRLTFNELKAVLKLDAMVYPADYQSSYDEVLNRFNRCYDCFITARINNEIIGYICFFPISHKLQMALKKGDFLNDSEILPEDVLRFEDAEGALYIISIVVHPKYQKSGVVRDLMNAFELTLMKLKNNFRIDEVIVSAISEKGESTLLKSDFYYFNDEEISKVRLMRREL